MVRTQIYLTEQERKELHSLGKITGQGQSELIRSAIDHFLQRTVTSNRLELIRKARGIWKGRPAIDLRALRREWRGR